MFVCLLNILGLAALAFGQENKIQLDVEKYQLANGLTVLLYEDHTTPALSFQQWFRVGSAYEHPHRTGLAHFFEHMMFKGTAKYPSKKLYDTIQSNGGTFNAFTSQDYTGFYQNYPAGKLELAIDIESDRMRNLLFDPVEIKNEREVVKEERRMRSENDVGGILEEAVLKTVFKVHPYRWPVIGSMKDLDATSLEDFRAFYNTYYAPNNAVVAVVGDFKKAEAKKLIDKYYAAIPRQLIPALVVAPEPEQRGVRQFSVVKPVQNPTFALAYPTSKSGDTETYAMDLLANILGEGASSRLYRKLVYQHQSALAVNVNDWTPKFPGAFQVFVTLKPGHTVDGVSKSVLSEIHAVRKEGVTDKELEKAKNQVMKSYVDSLKTNAGKAHVFELNEIVLGDYRQVLVDLDRYAAVTKEQIKDVANKYLTPQKYSLVEIQKTSAGGQKEEQPHEI